MNEYSECNTLVFRKKPQDFSPKMEVAVCYLEINSRFLFLRRARGKWGVPTVKIERNEGGLKAICRATYEETQIYVNQKPLTFIGKLFFKQPDLEYTCHLYHLKLDRIPVIKLNENHDAYRWLSANEVKDFPLISGGLKTLYHIKALANKPKLARKPFYFIRHGETNVNANPNIKRVDYDLPLNEKGKGQAFQARQIIKNLPFKSVCFSPIQRAVQTKNIVVSSVEIDQEPVEDLSECKAHVWTKMVQLEEGKGFHVCDEIEGFLKRTVRGIAVALQKAPQTLIVAHGGIHWALCYSLSIENHPWKIGNCELVYFQPIGEHDWRAELIKDL